MHNRKSRTWEIMPSSGASKQETRYTVSDTDFWWAKISKPHTIGTHDKSPLLFQERGKGPRASPWGSQPPVPHLQHLIQYEAGWALKTKAIKDKRHQEKSFRPQHFSEVRFSQKLFLCAQSLNRTHPQQRQTEHTLSFCLTLASKLWLRAQMKAFKSWIWRVLASVLV